MKLFILSMLFFIVQGCTSNNDSGDKITKVNLDEAAQKAFPNSSEEKKAAAKQIGGAIQAAIENPEAGLLLKNEPGKHVDKIAKAIACLHKTVKSEETEEVLNKMRAAILVTRANNKAYVKFNANLSGGMYPLWNEETQGNPCEHSGNKL